MTRTRWIWIGLAALYAAFFGWYTSFAGPLTDVEIAHFMALAEAREPRPSAERLAQNSYEAPIFSDISRGEGAENKARDALTAFAAGHYSETIDILEAEGDTDPLLSYLLGHAYYQNGDMDRAAALFSALAQQSGNPYRQGASWYLALAQLRAGETDSARQQLTAISQDSDNPNRQRAANLLGWLDSGWRVLVVGSLLVDR